MRNKRIVGICLVLFLLGIVARPGRAQEGPKKLLVAHAGLISTHSSVWLAEDQGFYKKHGLDVTAVFTGSGSVTSQALVAGEAKLASTSVGPTAGAVSAGADLVIVAGTNPIFPFSILVFSPNAPPPQLRREKDGFHTLP